MTYIAIFGVITKRNILLLQNAIKSAHIITEFVIQIIKELDGNWSRQAIYGIIFLHGDQQNSTIQLYTVLLFIFCDINPSAFLLISQVQILTELDILDPDIVKTIAFKAMDRHHTAPYTLVPVSTVIQALVLNSRKINEKYKEQSWWTRLSDGLPEYCQYWLQLDLNIFVVDECPLFD